MKNIAAIIFCHLVFMHTQAQTKWFSVYYDTITLTADANTVIQKIAKKVLKNNSGVNLSKNTAIKNTTPYLIFIDSNRVNLPFWEEVIEPQKKFFASLAGSETEGKKVFGLFFNGFYLAHELGHSFFARSGIKYGNNYDSEYDANTFAIAYWKAAGEKNNLKKCYSYAKKMLKSLKNPVPVNEEYKKYITEHYNELSADPYKYGYIQFSQFVEIYENKHLPGFDTYIKSF